MVYARALEGMEIVWGIGMQRRKYHPLSCEKLWEREVGGWNRCRICITMYLVSLELL
jgi:hypothetical protein